MLSSQLESCDSYEKQNETKIHLQVVESTRHNKKRISFDRSLIHKGSSQNIGEGSIATDKKLRRYGQTYILSAPIVGNLDQYTI